MRGAAAKIEQVLIVSSRNFGIQDFSESVQIFFWLNRFLTSTKLESDLLYVSNYILMKASI